MKKTPEIHLTLTVKDKLRAVDFIRLEKLSINKVAKMFKVHWKQVHKWLAQEEELRKLMRERQGGPSIVGPHTKIMVSKNNFWRSAQLYISSVSSFNHAPEWPLY